MTGTIVVGTDGSDTAELAVATAARLAVALDAPLHIVTAYEGDDRDEVNVGGDQWVFTAAGAAERVAEQSAEGVRSLRISVSSAALRGKPHNVLVKEAERLDAALIVVGNVRMQGAARVLGSVANSVAHHAPCDVYIAHTS